MRRGQKKCRPIVPDGEALYKNCFIWSIFACSVCRRRLDSDEIFGSRMPIVRMLCILFIMPRVFPCSISSAIFEVGSALERIRIFEVIAEPAFAIGLMFFGDAP